MLWVHLTWIRFPHTAPLIVFESVLNNKLRELMTPLVYIGLKTNNRLGIEATGLGDRILRWQAIITYAHVVKRDLIIPIFTPCSPKPHENICRKWLESAFHIPKFVTFVDYDKTIHNMSHPNAVYLEESCMFEAVTDFFGSIPNHMRKNKSSDLRIRFIV